MSGSDKEIKALKERFLRGKSTPNLSNYDIHVVCGCIKDFLRGLREPLIPTNLWKNFANAVQNNDEVAVRELFSAINQLPQANRDTLAFIVMHLQRFVTCLYMFEFLYHIYFQFKTMLSNANFLFVIFSIAIVLQVVKLPK